ncbi:uncharacterized protein LOC135713482 [Ochlerotatus camptorhynchus]|uniref:uncharacterized protein LOC135713482 n=1 Tax=Ochlerotatus camptorhynchus TaxID=644619 RepID=UPI0031DEF2EB
MPKCVVNILKQKVNWISTLFLNENDHENDEFVFDYSDYGQLPSDTEIKANQYFPEDAEMMDQFLVYEEDERTFDLQCTDLSNSVLLEWNILAWLEEWLEDDADFEYTTEEWLDDDMEVSTQDTAHLEHLEICQMYAAQYINEGNMNIHINLRKCSLYD